MVHFDRRNKSETEVVRVADEGGSRLWMSITSWRASISLFSKLSIVILVSPEGLAFSFSPYILARFFLCLGSSNPASLMARQSTHSCAAGGVASKNTSGYEGSLFRRWANPRLLKLFQNWSVWLVNKNCIFSSTFPKCLSGSKLVFMSLLKWRRNIAKIHATTTAAKIPIREDNLIATWHHDARLWKFFVAVPQDLIAAHPTLFSKIRQQSDRPCYLLGQCLKKISPYLVHSL